MALKNYTSTVPAARSVAFIEGKLAQNGARQILKYYEPDGRVCAICFMIELNGAEVPFKLPARVDECERVLRQNLSRRAKPETIKAVAAQAERTAWKILSDWIEAQMAMIELAQVEVMEVFLPYIYDRRTQQTLFQQVKERGYKALLPGTQNLH